MSDAPLDPAQPQEVTPVETFFDLVYVFAVSQLAEHLDTHLGWLGAAQTLLLLVAVFTIWSFTTFESTMVLARTASARWVLLFVMVVGLVMNASITGAFEDDPWSFVVPMVLIQVGRSAATARVDVVPVLRRHRFAMTVWALFSAVPWCLGAMSDAEHARLWWWLLAVAVDLAGALARHPLPGFRQEGIDRIRFDVAHQVERCRMFLLICLGEVIVRIGIGLARSPQNLGHVVAAVAAMLAVVCVWLVFFGDTQDHVDGWFDRHDEGAESRLGRLATYGQQVLVVAFVAYAVGTQMAVTEPDRPLETAGVVLLFGGMLLCLASFWAFLVALTGRRSWPPLLLGSVLVLVAAGVVDLLDLPGLVATLAIAAVMGVTAWAFAHHGPRLLASAPGRA